MENPVRVQIVHAAEQLENEELQEILRDRARYFSILSNDHLHREDHEHRRTYAHIIDAHMKIELRILEQQVDIALVHIDHDTMETDDILVLELV